MWRCFLQAYTVTLTRLERDLSDEADLPLTWYDVLVQLAQVPDRRLRMADLADRLLLSRSGITRLVDRLQAEGLVAREPYPGDARGTYTVLTEEGLRRLRGAAPIHLRGISEYWLGLFSDAELRTLGELLSRVGPLDPV